MLRARSRSWRPLFVLFGLGCGGAALGLAACGDDGGGAATPASVADGAPGTTGTNPAPVATGAEAGADVAIVPSVDPWNPPLGEAVVGVQTFDGWEIPRRLPAPVNVDGGWTDSVMVTADGRRLYLGYTTYDFEGVAAGRFEISGTRRSGQDADGFRMFEVDLRPDRW